MIKRIVSAILVLAVCFLSLISVFAQENDVAEDNFRHIVSYKIKATGKESVQDFIDSELPKNVGSSAEWYALSLLASKEADTYDFSLYKKALEDHLKEGKNVAASTRQKEALVLLALGSDSPLIGETFSKTVGKQGLMSLIFALHLARYGCEIEEYAADEIIDAVIGKQVSDGGWSISGKYSDVDVTAMTLQALSHFADTSEKVKEACKKGLEYLSSVQNENGGFSSYGKENAESSAQVIIALTSLGKDPETTEEFIKNGKTPVDALLTFKLSDGGFSHLLGENSAYNESATVQALMAFSSISKMRRSTGSVYDLGDISYDMPESSEISDKDDVKNENGIEDEKNDEKKSFFAENKYKIIIISALAVLCVLISAVLFIKGKRNVKSHIFIVLVFAVVTLAVLFSDIKAPGDYYGLSEEKKDPVGTVNISIDCKVLLSHNDERIPSDGIILEKSEFVIEKGDSALDILYEAARKYSLSLDESNGYVTGIAHLYEFDFGDLSGWTFLVNGEVPSVGASSYILSDGDFVEWKYTKDLGEDIK